jgi:Spy/CpxP family protein refolding chaperone
MSETNDNPQNADPAVESAQEPQGVDLAEAAAQEAAKQVPSKPKLDSTEFTPEQIAKIEAMMESRAQSESNRAVNKFKEQVENSGEYMSREDFDSALESKIAEERERNEAATQARASFDQHMGKLGIAPGTDKYRDVAKTYAKMEEAGAITPKALLTEEGVKALAFAAGAVDSSAAAGPQRGFDASHRLDISPPNEADRTVDDHAWAAVNKALGH